MNVSLLNEIVQHVFACFGVIPATFISHSKTDSLNHSNYLLSKKLEFQIDKEVISNKVWGCQLTLNGQDVKILLGDCKQSNDAHEFAMIVSLKNAPTYGLYIIYDDLLNNDPETMIACSLNGKEWLGCNTYLQATFLAGMEQLRELNFGWSNCAEYEEQYNILLSFIKHHEADDEGQEKRF